MSRVGVDLDGVIYNFEGALRVWMVVAKGYPPDRLVEATQWELANDWGITRAEFVEACEESVEAEHLFRYGPPINDAQFQLHRLRLHGHSIHIITARAFGTKSEPSTKRWIDEYGLPHDSLTFSNDKTSVPVDYMIDDKPENVMALADAGVFAVLQDRPYNRDFAATLRVESLAEFVDVVIQQEEKAA